VRSRKGIDDSGFSILTKKKKKRKRKKESLRSCWKNMNLEGEDGGEKDTALHPATYIPEKGERKKKKKKGGSSRKNGVCARKEIEKKGKKRGSALPKSPS